MSGTDVYDVYISHVRDDEAWARSLSLALSQRGLVTVAASDWDVSDTSLHALTERLDRSNSLVVPWSAAAVDSKVLHMDIARFAEHQHGVIIPVVLGEPRLLRLAQPMLAERQAVVLGADAYAAGPEAGSAEWTRAILVARALTTHTVATRDLPAFSGSARRALTYALRMLAGDASTPNRLRTAALLGALLESARRGMTPTTGDVVRLVLERQEGRRSAEVTLAEAAVAAGLQRPPVTGGEALPIEQLVSSIVGPLVRDAAQASTSTASDRVHLRHVLAAGVHEAVPAEVLDELGLTLTELRSAWRASLRETWPEESAEGWNVVLQDQGPGDVVAAPPPSARVHADRWTVEDRLDYALYAKAIAEFIRHPDAKPPLVISVQGPWGQGKTSLMRMVQRDLDPGHPDLRHVDGRTGRESASAPPSALTFGELRDALDGSVQVTDTKPATIRTVWFNAWKYQSSEQVWAGLAHAILAQLPARLSPRERELFWLRLQLRRIDPAAVREDIHKATVEKFLPMLAGWVALIIAAALAGGLALLVWGLKTIGAMTAAGGVVSGAIAVRAAWAKATRQALGRS